MPADYMFSQVPPSIIRSANVCQRPVSKQTKKRIKFNDEVMKKVPEVEASKSNQLEYIDIESLEDKKEEIECSSSSPIEQPDKIPVARPQLSDAIVQTEKLVKTCDRKVQTEESLLTRPLNMSDYESHRTNTQAQYVEFYKPMYSIPKRGKAGRDPPLKIGMSLPKGVKRKVYYPDEENEGRVDGA